MLVAVAVVAVALAVTVMLSPVALVIVAVAFAPSALTVDVTLRVVQARRGTSPCSVGGEAKASGAFMVTLGFIAREGLGRKKRKVSGSGCCRKVEEVSDPRSRVEFGLDFETWGSRNGARSVGSTNRVDLSERVDFTARIDGSYENCSS